MEKRLLQIVKVRPSHHRHIFMTHNDYDNTHVSTRNFRATRNSHQPMRDVTLLLWSECILAGGQRQLLPALAYLWTRIDNRHDFPLCFWFGFCLLAKRTWLFIALYHFMLLSGGMWQQRLSDMCKAFYGFACLVPQCSKIGFKLSISALRLFKRIQMVKDINRSNLSFCGFPGLHSQLRSCVHVSNSWIISTALARFRLEMKLGGSPHLMHPQ
jgi:hypothetical protein